MHESVNQSSLINIANLAQPKNICRDLIPISYTKHFPFAFNMIQLEEISYKEEL